MNTFKSLGLSDSLCDAISKLGFVEPMPIQSQTIPSILNQEGDIIGLAQTGTGKTAAFGLPILQHIDTKDANTQALILAPTRELCLQITKSLESFAVCLKNLRIVSVYGGSDIGKQFDELRRGAHIIVATPGRLLDIINRKNKADLSSISYLVLDEADEMLNMGFKDELDAILETTPGEKTTLLFSATMSSPVRRIANNYMKDPIEFTVKQQGQGNKDIDHQLYYVSPKNRFHVLQRIIDFNPGFYGIVFCRTRMDAKEIAEDLTMDGYKAEALHGDLSQAQRETVMKKFRNKHIDILIATDVAARGLDVKDVNCVINYSLPDELETYIHRSGRTGRAGQVGTSIIMLRERERFWIKRLEKKLGRSIKINKIPNGDEICEKQLFRVLDSLQEESGELDSDLKAYVPTAESQLAEMTKEELISLILKREFSGILNRYKNAKNLNQQESVRSKRNTQNRSRDGRDSRDARDGRDSRDARDSRDGRDRNNGRKSRSSKPARPEFVKLHINLGKSDQLSAKDVIGFVNRSTRTRNVEIGKIELKENFSFFEIDGEFVRSFMNGFKKIKFERPDIKVERAQI